MKKIRIPLFRATALPLTARANPDSNGLAPSPVYAAILPAPAAAVYSAVAAITCKFILHR